MTCTDIDANVELWTGTTAWAVTFGWWAALGVVVLSAIPCRRRRSP